MTKEQTLHTLDQLGTFVMTKKKVPAARQEAYSEDVLKVLSLYRRKAEKAEMPEQFRDIIEAAKNEFKAAYDKHTV